MLRLSREHFPPLSLFFLLFLLFTEYIFYYEPLDTGGTSWAPHVEYPTVTSPKTGQDCL